MIADRIPFVPGPDYPVGRSNDLTFHLCVSFASWLGRLLVTDRNEFVVDGKDRFLAQHRARLARLREREKDGEGGSGGEGDESGARSNKVRGLLTVMNHASIVDEPSLMPCAFMDHAELLEKDAMVWSPTSAALSFSSPIRAWYCRNVQALPVGKGKGVNQEEMGTVARILGEGGWVNFFPQGRVVQAPIADKDGAGTSAAALSRIGGKDGLKTGVGRLIYEPEVTPAVLIVVHSGMERIKPMRKMFTMGNTVHVKVGEPLDLSAVVEDLKRKKVIDKHGEPC